jgi:tRNA pseudouridine synthase 10
VAVHGLHAATASQLGHLKEGEQEKQKSYMAVCWLSRPLTDADVALLGATRELEVQQQTPIRVRARKGRWC